MFGDSLKDIETFWDAILRAFTNLCQNNQAYPHYRDLDPSFQFWTHLVGDKRTSKLSSTDYEQSKRNYRSFGDALRIFLRSKSTTRNVTHG